MGPLLSKIQDLIDEYDKKVDGPIQDCNKVAELSYWQHQKESRGRNIPQIELNTKFIEKVDLFHQKYIYAELGTAVRVRSALLRKPVLIITSINMCISTIFDATH